MKQRTIKRDISIVCIIVLLTVQTRFTASAEELVTEKSTSEAIPQTNESETHENAVIPDEQMAEEILDSLKGEGSADTAEEFLEGLNNAADTILNSENVDEIEEDSFLKELLDWLIGLVKRVFGFVEAFYEETLNSQ